MGGGRGGGEGGDVLSNILLFECFVNQLSSDLKYLNVALIKKKK